MFNMNVYLSERHFMHEGRDCYYKIWVADIEYSKNSYDETTVETQQFNTKRDAIRWALNRAYGLFTI